MLLLINILNAALIFPGESEKMITRLEVDGFKNLVNFSLDLGPFTCIAGPNSVGKSNIFDAIQFLSLLADHTLTEAALKIRGSGQDAYHIRDLFWTNGINRRGSFRIAAEMIVEGSVQDDFGRFANSASTFLRYEIQIRYEEPSTEAGLLGRLVLEEENLDYITQGEASTHLKFPHSANQFRNSAIKNTRRTSGYISTKSDNGKKIITIHQDGGSRGPGQAAPADTASRTIVGLSNTSATPTILAARREMQSWRLLALEPSAMRMPDHFLADPHVTVNGGHLPAVIYRLATEARKRGKYEHDVYSEITNRLSELISVSYVKVVVEEVRQLLTLMVTETSGISLPTNSLSDGTLRFLALAIIASDPSIKGLICMEEPENGIHPAKIEAMVNLLREIAVNVDESISDDNPLRQLIVATHSPAFVQLQNKDDLLFATEAIVRYNNQRIQVLRCKPLENTWRAKSNGDGVGLATIMVYLTTPPGAQINIPM
jgi:predicted ATPase